MKPFRVLVFVLSVFGILFLLAIFFPRDGISLGSDMRLRFYDATTLFQKDTVSTAYTDSLIRHATVTDDPEEGEVDTLLFRPAPVILARPDPELDSLIKAHVDSIRNTVYPIEFGGNSRKQMYAFFRKAENSLPDDKLIRILHYGDSQIENDRMTSLLRNRLQRVFGGGGCGMVPAIPLYYGNPAFMEEYQGDWRRYTGFGKKDSTLQHNCYGTLASFTSIPLAEEDRLPYLDFEFRKGRRASDFNTMKLWLHANEANAAIIFHLNDTISDTIRNLPAGYQELQVFPGGPAQNVRLEFNFPEGGRVYGIGFDSRAGVQVDNIAMRGSSGLVFSKMDRQHLDTMMQTLNPGLLILQFGGNVVPYIKNVSYYRKKFNRELLFLKELLPGVPILVVGPADMSTKENGKFVTFPALIGVRDALREAALSNGCSYWDMFEAMGGENSISNFVMADPPLATADYIHFTPRGANLMAGMLFDAIMFEYNHYKLGE